MEVRSGLCHDLHIFADVFSCRVGTMLPARKLRGSLTVLTAVDPTSSTLLSTWLGSCHWKNTAGFVFLSPSVHHTRAQWNPFRCDPWSDLRRRFLWIVVHVTCFLFFSKKTTRSPLSSLRWSWFRRQEELQDCFRSKQVDGAHTNCKRVAQQLDDAPMESRCEALFILKNFLLKLYHQKWHDCRQKSADFCHVYRRWKLRSTTPTTLVG